MDNNKFVFTDGEWWYVPTGAKENRGRAYVGVCKMCGKGFISKRPQPNCSPKCGKDAQRKQRVVKQCAGVGCSNMFSPPASRPERKYCSQTCAKRGTGPVT